MLAFPDCISFSQQKVYKHAASHPRSPMWPERRRFGQRSFSQLRLIPCSPVLLLKVVIVSQSICLPFAAADEELTAAAQQGTEWRPVTSSRFFIISLE